VFAGLFQIAAMFPRLAVAAVVLNAGSAHSKNYQGEWKGSPWSYRMNELPVGCKQGSANPASCSVQSMWHKFGRSEYYSLGESDVVSTNGGSEGRKTWSESNEFCQALGGHTIHIGSENEMEFAITLMANNRHGFWLGMFRSDNLFPEFPEKKGFERWLDATRVDWSNWAEGEPNSPRYGTDSGALVDTYFDKCAFQGTNQGDPSLWNDASCEKKRRVICERPLSNSFGDDSCNGVRDPPECASYYGARCHNVNGLPTVDFDKCAVKCNSCLTTTTTVQTTTSSFQTTTTTQVPSTTTSVVTTTSSFVTTTSTFQTTTSTFQSTTSTFQTTTSTAEATTSTTGTTTTVAPSTTTTEAPITEARQYLGVCMQTPAKGWHSYNTDPNNLFAPVVPGGEEMHCCYKYINKPRLSWGNAQAQCEAVGTAFPFPGSFAGLATAYVPEINTKLTDIMLQNSAYDSCEPTNSGVTKEMSCRDNANGETTWLGGKTENGSRVEWVNPFFAAFSDEDYGSNGTEYHFDPTGPTDDNGMFYDGEPSKLNMNNGRTGSEENCLSQGGDRKRVNEFGFAGWNDAKCGSNKGYFCEYCVRLTTTTTFEPTTTTTGKASTITTMMPTTTTTVAPTTTTTVPTTTTSVDPTSTTTMEPTTTTTAAPTSTSTVEPDCAAIVCGGECGMVWQKGDPEYSEYCGWSKKYSACVHGGRTVDSEKFMGECGTTITTPKPQNAIQNCAASYCSRTCGNGNGSGAANKCSKMDGTTCAESECGWSRKYNRCIVGGFTNAMEANSDLGPIC
jgi:hypothetical protein